MFGIGVVREAGRFEPGTQAVLTVLVAATAVGIVVIGWRRARRPAPLERTAQLVARWQAAGKPLDRLLVFPGLEAPLPGAPEPDIFDYGAEVVLIVDDDLAVDLLVRNGFGEHEPVPRGVDPWVPPPGRVAGGGAARAAPPRRPPACSTRAEPRCGRGGGGV